MRSARILIVEDEATTSMDLKYRIETLGHHVLGVVDTAAKAVEFVRRYRPDLVLMDIALRGEVDGIAAARDIWLQTGTPFVYVTAYSENILHDRVDAVEPYGFVGKPFHDRELQAAIELALHKSAVETSVRKQERLLHAFVAGMRDGAIGVDKQRRVLFMNPIAEALTGRRSKDALQQDVLSVLRTDEADARRDLEICIGIVLRDGGAMTVADVPLLKREDATVTVETTITAVRSRKGETEGAAILLHDTTERQAYERKLNLQRHFFRQLFDESPEAIAILDRNDMVLDVNRAFTDTFRYTSEEAKGKSINDLIVPSEFSCEAQRLSEMMYSDAIVRAEGLRRRKDGTTIPVSILAKPIMLAEDRIGGIVIYREITDAQCLTAVRHQRLKVVEQLPIPTLIGDAGGTVIFANRKYLEVTGQTLKDTVGKRVRMLNLEPAESAENVTLVLNMAQNGEWQDGMLHVREVVLSSGQEGDDKPQ